ncbi:transposase [Rhodococcus wratislaviensis]|uniref:transposase n=1 Tax=Rhodococcus wratislaviensis TaxID=44752 RepID=UPI00210043ED|nr:transposase [Rhodococcus wratislaviensis]
MWSGNCCRGQSRDFVTYKAASVGVPVEVIDPRNTSRTCYPCGHVDKVPGVREVHDHDARLLGRLINRPTVGAHLTASRGRDCQTPPFRAGVR